MTPDILSARVAELERRVRRLEMTGTSQNVISQLVSTARNNPELAEVAMRLVRELAEHIGLLGANPEDLDGDGIKDSRYQD